MNSFYRPFDKETYRPRKGHDPYRTPFEVDRDRIIYTPAFRRLQAKTQVFMAGEFDFYRTRLTHSIEVAQVGRSICGFLNKTSPHLGPDFHIDSDLVEAICLAHDLGHPPFGHAGERTLNRLMADWGGFEGNAQTARILTETIYGEGAERRGMAPTRALLDGVLKYKRLWMELPPQNRENHFLYDDQLPLREFVLGGTESEYNDPAECRSIECQIMDWADDTAYSTNDIVDGCHAGFVTVNKLDDWGNVTTLDAFEQNALENLKSTLRDRRVDGHFGRLTGDFLRACQLTPAAGPLAGLSARHSVSLEVNPEIERESRFLQRVARELVFWSPQLHHLEHKSDFILRRIFGVLADRHLAAKPADGRAIHLLPASAVQALQAEPTQTARARFLCDYIAGMTDGYAIRTYKRLFDPDFSSIMELG